METIIQKSNSSHNSLFLNFLWGMETGLWSHATPPHGGFWTSYEGWKPKKRLFIWEKREEFLNFLWGMETWTIRRDGYRQRRVFELPMRDGNLFNTVSHMGGVSVFELPMRDGNCFDKTLKSNNRCRFLNFLWGMETRKDNNLAFARVVFLNFLWGMETRVGQVWHSINCVFLNFLWGMETRLHHYFAKRASHRFWTSYEGWKPVSLRFVPSYPPRFWTSYEGWKRYGELKKEEQARWFLNFLWGMETRQAAPILEMLKSSFWTSYEGWKPSGNASSKGTSCSGFWTSYEGWKLFGQQTIWRSEISFWTSYEGWKRKDTEGYKIAKSCFWTSYEGWKQENRFILVDDCDWFLNFLWGMETKRLPTFIKLLHWFLNFLWGMETSRPPPRSPDVVPVFELPMRDGNIPPCSAGPSTTARFLNFLWGMETHIRNRRSII